MTAQRRRRPGESPGRQQGVVDSLTLPDALRPVKPILLPSACERYVLLEHVRRLLGCEPRKEESQ